MSGFRSTVLTSSCPKFERLFCNGYPFFFSLYFSLFFFFFCEKFGCCPARPKIVIRHVCNFTTEGHKYMLPIEGVKMALIPLLIYKLSDFPLC